MRVLLLSDIHSNLQALEAVITAAPQYDVVWNLGDVVGYGANPNEVIDRVQQLGTTIVRGNHDRACCGMDDMEDFNPIAARAARWTQSVLTGDRLEWLRNLSAGPLVPGKPDVSCVHGSPADEDEYVTNPTDAWESLHVTKARITLFGHTHIQGAFATDGEEMFELMPYYSSACEAEQDELRLRKGARYLVNPGSVGQPRDHDWRAAFALFDDEASRIAWYRVPYRVEAAQASIRAAGLPDLLADRLSEGR